MRKWWFQKMTIIHRRKFLTLPPSSDLQTLSAFEMNNMPCNADTTFSIYNRTVKRQGKNHFRFAAEATAVLGKAIPP
jgi:hypothetical protein